MSTITAEDIATYVGEFYSTRDPGRRKEVGDFLETIKRRPNCWQVGMQLLSNAYSPSVQFFGVSILYDSLCVGFNEISEDAANTDGIKTFLVQNLTSGVQAWSHSVLNKLFSTLAVFTLKCIPEIWSNPYAELMALWQNQQELLLRVMAEVAAEFPRLSVPLKHRGMIKTELLQTCGPIVQTTYAALVDADSSPSMKNAAIECIELWLKLPGVALTTFLPVIEVVFSNIAQDTVALARMISILKSNEELEHMPRLVSQITQFLAATACPLVVTQLTELMAEAGENFADDVDEIVGLISAITEFAVAHIDYIVIAAGQCAGSTDQSAVQAYRFLCQFFHHISSFPGKYPVEECFSDLPEQYWSALRDCLVVHQQGDKLPEEKRRLLVQESTTFFLQVLQSAIDKIAYFDGIDESYDKADLEKFDAYRISRSEVSANAICVSSTETMALIARVLNGSLHARDMYKSEAVLYYLKEAASYLTEEELKVIAGLLPPCGDALAWPGMSSAALRRYAVTLMECLNETEHLILTYENAQQLIPPVVSATLHCLSIHGAATSSLDTLVSFLKGHDDVMAHVVDSIITECYKYFENESVSESSRLEAIRCVGFGLSYKTQDVIMHSLDQILLPRLLKLGDVLKGKTDIPADRQESVVLFELGVVSRLVATLDTKQASENSSSPVRIIVDQCLPLFDTLLAHSSLSANLANKVCEVLRSSIVSLHNALNPLLETYLRHADTLMRRYPAPAVELAKSLLLALRGGGEHATVLLGHLAVWFSASSGSPTHHNQAEVVSELDDRLVELAFHVVRKNWALVEAGAKGAPNETHAFVKSVCIISAKLVRVSRDVAMIRDGLRLLAAIVKNCAMSSEPLLRQCLIDVGEVVLTSVYGSISREHVTGSIQTIAEILFYYAQMFPAETRNVIFNLSGDDAFAKSMFGPSLSVKNFRLRISQLHQAALKTV